MSDLQVSTGLKGLVSRDDVRRRFQEVLGDKASAFLASVLNATRVNPQLAEADPMSVLSSAMVAATLDLPIDGNLGFAAIVPYRVKGKMVAQFQIMTRGFIQLALRTGQYKAIHAGPVYSDELKGIDPITGDVMISAVPGGYREKGDEAQIVGYVAFFRLVNGFECVKYWPLEKIRQHGRKYSKSYENEYGLWRQNFPAMAEKTVLKNTLSKWGILSTTMQMAVKVDQAALRIESPTQNIDTAAIEYVDAREEEPTEPKAPHEIVKPAANTPAEPKSKRPPVDLEAVRMTLFEYLAADIPEPVRAEIEAALNTHGDDAAVIVPLLEKVKAAYGK